MVLKLIWELLNTRKLLKEFLFVAFDKNGQMSLRPKPFQLLTLLNQLEFQTIAISIFEEIQL